MLYKVSKDLQVGGSGNSYISPGIHEDIVLTNVEYRVSEKGNEFLAFYFENEIGEKLPHTEWQVRFGENMDEKEKEAYESKVVNQMRRVQRIVTAFIPDDEFDFEVDTFKDFAENTVKILGDRYKDKKVRLKVVYDNRNFASIPTYTRYPWIESMEVPVEKSKIRKLSIDRWERLPYDREANNPNPLEETATDKSKEKDDLPF